MPTTKTTEEIDALLAMPFHAVVGINRASGAPQLTVVWFLWDAGTFSFSTTRDRAKYHNLRRDPSVSLLVDDFESKWYVAAYGRAEILEEGHAEFARRLFEKYMPGRDPGPAVVDPRRVIVRVKPDRIVTGS